MKTDTFYNLFMPNKPNKKENDQETLNATTQQANKKNKVHEPHQHLWLAHEDCTLLRHAPQ